MSESTPSSRRRWFSPRLVSLVAWAGVLGVIWWLAFTWPIDFTVTTDKPIGVTRYGGTEYSYRIERLDPEPPDTTMILVRGLGGSIIAMFAWASLMAIRRDRAARRRFGETARSRP